MAYSKPNTHSIPNELCDQHMKDLSGSEFKVLYLIARKTCGFHKDVEALGYDRISRHTGVSRESVRTAVKVLEERGLIVRQKVIDEATGMNGETLYSLAVDEPGEPEGGVPKIGIPPGEGGVPKIGTGVYQKSAYYKGTNETINETDNIPPTPNPENQNPTALRADGPTLDPEELKRYLPSRFKALKGWGGFNGQQKRILEEKLAGLSGVSTEQVYAAVESFGEETFWREYADPLRKIRSFFKYLSNGEWPVSPDRTEPSREAAEPSVKFSTGGVLPPDPGIQPSAPERDLIDVWNELVPYRPADRSLFRPAQYSPKYQAELAPRMEECCRKAGDLIQRGADINYGKLLRSNRDTTRFGWQELLAGEWDWMAKDKKKPKPKPGDGLTWEQKRELRQQEEKRRAAETAAVPVGPTDGQGCPGGTVLDAGVREGGVQPEGPGTVRESRSPFRGRSGNGH